MMNMRRPGKWVGLGFLVATTITSAAGWYTATHASSGQHFESCRVQADGTVILGYTYGVGDKVTTSVQSTPSGIIVSLQRDRASGTQPAVLLYGELRFDSSGGLRGRLLRHSDGTVLPCSDAAP